MKRFCGFFPSSRRRGFATLAAAILVLSLGARFASGQAAESANAGGAHITVGGGASGLVIQYGNRFMVDATAWVDADTIRRFGFEGETRLIHFNQTDNVHAETYLGGMRYHMNVGRYQPYVKGMAGLGHFNFPYNLATGNYFVAAGGGGVDARFTRHWSVRTEFEYQRWPQFTYGAMSIYGFTMGARYRIF